MESEDNDCREKCAKFSSDGDSALHCFVYGTLMNKDILSRLLPGASFALQEAQLRGYRRYKLRNRRYPAIRPCPSEESGSVNGLLVDGLSAQDLAKLHDYEGDEYQYQSVTVKTSDGHDVETSCYVWREELESELLKDDTDWDFYRFSQLDPQAWINLDSASS